MPLALFLVLLLPVLGIYQSLVASTATPPWHNQTAMLNTSETPLIALDVLSRTNSQPDLKIKVFRNQKVSLSMGLSDKQLHAYQLRMDKQEYRQLIQQTVQRQLEHSPLNCQLENSQDGRTYRLRWLTASDAEAVGNVTAGISELAQLNHQDSLAKQQVASCAINQKDDFFVRQIMQQLLDNDHWRPVS
ncbi:hypothetical protein [Pelagibaculum spongiae]|uniref:Uncharacterized protein n=1 Tax=Pelagibaculum spongiae TaxID=2080658 RepID=A0A2V1GV28_9GAMM|nr:hypothetical protein [Pelagibaculum spongiae]PVZ63565.1 hypothetical protein DC094_21010 [Pelagibaculum spongiae]